MNPNSDLKKNIYCVLLLTHVFCEILKDAATEFSTWFRRGQKRGTMVSQEFLERRGDVTGTFDAKSSQKEYWFAHDQQLRHGDEKAGWGVETLTSKHSGSNPFAVRNLCPQPESKEEREKKKKKKRRAHFLLLLSIRLICDAIVDYSTDEKRSILLSWLHKLCLLTRWEEQPKLAAFIFSSFAYDYLWTCLLHKDETDSQQKTYSSHRRRGSWY